MRHSPSLPPPPPPPGLLPLLPPLCHSSQLTPLLCSPSAARSNEPGQCRSRPGLTGVLMPAPPAAGDPHPVCRQQGSPCPSPAAQHLHLTRPQHAAGMIQEHPLCAAGLSAGTRTIPCKAPAPQPPETPGTLLPARRAGNSTWSSSGCPSRVCAEQELAMGPPAPAAPRSGILQLSAWM